MWQVQRKKYIYIYDACTYLSVANFMKHHRKHSMSNIISIIVNLSAISPHHMGYKVRVRKKSTILWGARK